MSEISETQAIEMFLHGLMKSRAAAKQLAVVERGNGWDKVAKNLDMLLETGKKLFSGKPQTRMETLALTSKIEQDNTPAPITMH